MVHLSWCFCSNPFLFQWSDLSLPPSLLSFPFYPFSISSPVLSSPPLILILISPLTKHLLMSPYTLDIILIMQTNHSTMKSSFARDRQGWCTRVNPE